MTKILTIFLALFVLSCSCSDEENTRHRRTKREVIPEITPEATPTPELEQAVVEPEQPTEPETTQVEYFYVGSSAIAITCYNKEAGPCGIDLIDCSNGYNYYCLTNLKSEIKEELVK